MPSYTFSAPATSVDFDCSSAQTLALQITGNWDGTAQYQLSYDGTNFVQAWGLDDLLADGQLYGTNTDDYGNGPASNLKFNVSGAQIFRLNVTAAGASGTSTFAIQAISGVSVLTAIISPVSTIGPLTDTQLRDSPVSVSVSSLPLPSGAATDALQTTGNASLSSIDAKLPSGLTVTGSRLQVELPSGAATEATLSAVNAKTPALGQAVMASSTPVVIASNQSTLNVAMVEASVLFKGRASTFNTPGRAGTAGQKILSLHNAAGSAVTVKVTKVTVDLSSTVVKAITVAPPIVRLWKVTVLPTNGTALTKNKIGGTTTSSASVTVLGDASADGTGSATTLTATLPAGAIITQEYAPRFITAAGYEAADRMEFLGDTSVTLSALEGLVVFLDYTLATQNPTTDRWIASIEWTES